MQTINGKCPECWNNVMANTGECSGCGRKFALSEPKVDSTELLNPVSNKFPIGSYARCTMSNRVFMVTGYSYGNTFVPDGWLMDKSGVTANPSFCRPYSGATSVLKGI